METNVISILLEATAANVKTVLADDADTRSAYATAARSFTVAFGMRTPDVLVTHVGECVDFKDEEQGSIRKERNVSIRRFYSIKCRGEPLVTGDDGNCFYTLHVCLHVYMLDVVHVYSENCVYCSVYMLVLETLFHYICSASKKGGSQNRGASLQSACIPRHSHAGC